MVNKESDIKGQTFKYHGFISYSQTSDQQFAPVIRSALHQFARPWHKLRALNIFLDTSSLAGDPNLSGALVKALQETKWLLVLASPDSARSIWVQQEVKWWLDNRSTEHLLILLTEGKIIWDRANNDFDWRQTTALPELLRGQISLEPLYVDLRKVKKTGQFTLRSLLFRDAIASIAAPLHNIPKDALDGEDIRQYRKFIVVRRIFVVLVIGVIGLMGWVYVQNNKAEQNLINLQANTAENAINANIQLEALIAAVKAGRKLQAMNEAWDSFMQTVVDASGWNETNARVVSKLQQVLAVFHEKNRLEEHSDVVSALASSQDCPNHTSVIVSGGKDGKLMIWLNPTDNYKPLILEHGGPITSVSIAPDCSTVASGGIDNKIKLWQTSGKLLKEIINDSEIKTLDYSPDGHWLVSGDESGKITLWNNDGEKVQSIDAYDGIRLLSTSIQQCPNGQQLLLSASASLAKPLKLWELDQQLHPVSGFFSSKKSAKAKIRSVSLSPDCNSIAAGNEDGTITLRKPDGKPYLSWQAHQGPVNGIRFSHDNQLIVSGGEADLSSPNIEKVNSVNLWKSNGEMIASFDGHRRAVTGVAFGNNANTLVSASADKTIRVWNVESVPVVKKISFDTAARSAEINPEGDKAAIFRTDNKIEIIDLKQNQHKLVSTQLPSELELLFGAENAVYYLNRETQTLHSLDNRKAIVFNNKNGIIHHLSFNPERKFFAFNTDDNVISISDFDGKLIDSFKGYSTSGKTLSFDSDGRSLAFLASDKEPANIKIRKVEGSDNKEIEIPTKHQDEINQIVFAPDGKTFATASKDRSIKLWSREGQALNTFVGHDHEVTNVAFHPANKMLASSDFAGTVIIWSLNGRIMLRLNDASKANIWALKFNRDGDRLIAVSQDSVTLWSFGLTELLQQGCIALKDFLATHPDISSDTNNLCQSD